MNEVRFSVTCYTEYSTSTIHHILQASRRRLAVRLIAHRVITTGAVESTEATAKRQQWRDGIVVQVRQLAREIVSIEEDMPIERATGEPYHNVYTALIQTHLPKLDDVAAIEYDSDRKTVTPDQNLLAFALVVEISAPVARLLFHDSIAKLYGNDTPSAKDAITD
jgi:hypothetical protein